MGVSRHLNLALAFVLGLAVMQTINVWRKNKDDEDSPHHFQKSLASLSTKPVLRNPSDHHKCRFYLATSAVAPNAGLGLFAGVGLLEGDMVGNPDICLFVDSPREVTHMDTHTWGWATFFGQFENRRSRAACEGFPTQFNTMPESHINTQMVGPVQPTTAGVKRKSPGAGSITHHFGVHAVALDVIPAGEELTLSYGDWDFGDTDPGARVRPRKSVRDLEETGWCVDNIEVRQSTIEEAGRGAFVKRRLAAGETVAPAPLQFFNDRAHFQHSRTEEQFVNYCFQPEGSKVLIYPYGAGVGLINHSLKKPNVGLRWSDNPSHKSELLNMGWDEFWNNVKPGDLILEYYALRQLQPGEELLMNYDPTWDKAWKDHVKQWKPPQDADLYVYPEEVDDTGILRTMEEQSQDPYPSNLMPMCHTPDVFRSESRHIEWYPGTWEWSETMLFCHILDRQRSKFGDYEYTVSLIFFNDNPSYRLTEKDLKFDPSIPFKDRFVDTKVPRRAIRFVEKPFVDDEHLPNSFRHPMVFPRKLTPNAWKTER